MPVPYVTLTDVSHVYEAATGGSAAVKALSGITCSIANGERVGIIGDNGAGKSTLLQIIAGVMPPTHGHVDIRGQVHAILTVGLGLREEATGRENLFLEGALLGKSEVEIANSLEEMIAFAELGEFIDRPVRTYSSGMKSRLAFASLTHIDPEVLIIDEALSVGDTFFAAKATQMIHKLCERGRIVLLVTHSAATIKQMCQRCIWLEGGRIKLDGSSNEVAGAYETATRIRQEAEIARRFGGATEAWMANPDVTLSAARLVRVGDRLETALIEAGTGGAIEVTLRTARAIQEASLDVVIEANDGLVLAAETRPLSLSFAGPGTHRLSIGLGAVDWRPKLYRATLAIQERGQVLARIAVVFGVYSDVTIFGGSPLLRTPPLVSARSK